MAVGNIVPVLRHSISQGRLLFASFSFGSEGAMDSPDAPPKFLSLVTEFMALAAEGRSHTRGFENFEKRLDRLEERLLEMKLAMQSPTPSVTLTLEEAIRYTGTKSDSGFRKWCKRWKVQRCDHGTYSRRALDAGKRRQAAARPKPRKPYTRKKGKHRNTKPGSSVYPEAA